MKKILFTWELGAGLGHLQPIRQRSEYLSGHALFAAVQNLKSANRVLKDTPVQLLQAPKLNQKKANQNLQSRCYAELLANSIFFSEQDIFILLKSWMSLFKLVQPDLVIFDHSPGALLAARAFDFKKIICGSGFMCPPVEEPFGVFYQETINKSERLEIKSSEEVLLKCCNKALRQLSLTPLESLAEIYRADKTFISSLPVFDHFNRRADTCIYTGINKIPDGATPKWPSTGEVRIYAYLKPFPNIGVLIQEIVHSGHAAIIYSNNINPTFLMQFSAPNIRFASEPQSLQEVASSCDFAIVNSNHDTAAQLLLLGVPLLTIPLTIEQDMLTRKLAKTGAVFSAHPSDTDQIKQTFREMNKNLVIHKRTARNTALKLTSDNNEHSQMQYERYLDGIL